MPNSLPSQGQGELDELLEPLKRDRSLRVVELPSSKKASERSRGERIGHRRSRYLSYFATAEERPLVVGLPSYHALALLFLMLLPFSFFSISSSYVQVEEIAIYGDKATIQGNLMVGLADHSGNSTETLLSGETVGLGVLRNTTKDTWSVYTPVKAEIITGVHLGALKWVSRVFFRGLGLEGRACSNSTLFS